VEKKKAKRPRRKKQLGARAPPRHHPWRLERGAAAAATKKILAVSAWICHPPQPSAFTFLFFSAVERIISRCNERRTGL